MSFSIQQNGIVTSSNILETEIYGGGKQLSIGKSLGNNILPNSICIYTDKNGTISSNTSFTSINVVPYIGQTLIFSYDVCTIGDRWSTENGYTDYSKTRYGIHGGMYNSSNQFPFAGYLNYSGNSTRVFQTCTVPSNATTLSLAIQNFDKPASTNNAIWFIKNVKLEVDGYSPYIDSRYDSRNLDYIETKEIYEI